MRHLLVATFLLVGAVPPARAQISVGVDIGVHVPVFPELVLVPGYPVYYDPRASTNYFFYDGVYWVYHGDGWYMSSWYDGPWRFVPPGRVPLYVLRVPVRYYRTPPPYFRGWREDEPPRWGERWGRGWERGHPGWDRWDRRAMPRPAPLPAYQREWGGDRYPRSFEQQHAIRSEGYRYRPREIEAREHYRERGPEGGPRPGPQREWRGPQEPQRERGQGRGQERREERGEGRGQERREEGREGGGEHGHGRR